MRLPPTLAGALALLVALAGCGDDSDVGASGCGPIIREALDPSYLVHVLGDATAEYTSDPPTSGPHQATPPIEGVVDEPLSRPVQVGVLERGDVLLQHDPELPAAERDDLAALAGAGVVVAPNPDLDDPVVATAWLHKRTCERVDGRELEEFVEQRRGRGPED
ncbi:MAG: DUF3105 domain-containing protein [Acidimicrobiales bacterium]|nr:DUF3105 domain-containing protein [Acidimicrobiales bacterium]